MKTKFGAGPSLHIKIFSIYLILVITSKSSQTYSFIYSWIGIHGSFMTKLFAILQA